MSEFGLLDLEEMAGENARLTSEGGGGNFLDQFVPMPEVKPGQTASVAVRILPPVKGGKLFQYNRTHKINGRSVHCPRPMVNGKWDRAVPCPICDYYSGLWKQIEKLEKQYGKDCPQAKPLKEEARAIKATERYYYNAVVRSMMVDGKEMKNVGPRILSVGVKLHKAILGAICGIEGDPSSKLGNITDVKAGWDLIIRKTITGSDGFPNYDTSSFARQQSPAGSPEEIEKWQASLHDLTKLRNPKGLDVLEKELAIHRGLIADETEGFDTESFDNKWRAKDGSGGAATTTSAPAAKTATVKTETAAPAVTAPAAEAPTQTIEDADFLKQLEEMEG